MTMRHPKATIWLALGLAAGALYLLCPLDDSTIRLWVAPGQVGPVPSLTGLRVGVVETTAHHDVIGSVLAVLHDLQANFTFYRHRKFSDGFEEVLRDVYPYQPSSHRELEARLKINDLDALVMTTCDAKFWWDFAPLFDTITQSSVPVICIPHEIEGFNVERNRLHLEPLAKSDRLSILTLVDHATVRMRTAVDEWEVEEEAWKGVEVSTFTPVFRLPAGMRQPRRRIREGIPTSAAILGRMINWARRYEEIAADLLAAMEDDLLAWGYRKESSAANPRETVFRPVVDRPFKLHLIGKPDKDSAPRLPESLDNVIEIHENADYDGFYHAIGDVDVILPAFKKQLYYDSRASAAIPAAIISRTPLLGHADLLVAYPYLAPPALVMHDSELSEIDAIARLRAGGDERLKGSERDWEEYEKMIMKENMAVWAGLLRP